MSDALGTSVHIEGGAKSFGDLTLADVTARAEELEAVVGFGPTSRVGPVARAWRELARSIETAGVQTVRELDDPDISKRAEQLWVVPPGGSLL